MLRVICRTNPYVLFPLVMLLGTALAQSYAGNSIILIGLYSGLGLMLAYFSKRASAESTFANELNSQDELLKGLGLKSASLVHNIRNYMSILQGTASLISREVNDKSNVKQALDIQNSCLVQAKAMLDDLISAIRSDGKYPKTSRPITSVLEEALQLAEILIEKTETQVLRQFETETTEFKYNDIGLMQSVVNIIKNSAEACASSGTIVVATRISNHNLQKVFQIVFKDNGKGLDATTMHNLFRPFSSRKQDGVGIGLYTVKNLIERDGGSVEIKSVENQGTEVILNYPCYSGHQE